MKNLKIWFYACLVFAFISLDTLVEESHEVIYEKSNETEEFQYLACKKLRALYPNQSVVDLKHLRDDLCDYFTHSVSWKDMPESRELLLNRTKTGGYLVLNRMVCLILKDKSELQFKVENFLKRAVYLAIKKGTFNFVQVAYPDYAVDQLIVVKKAHPYSDCSQSNARFRCLHDCFKRKARLSRYFYESNETGLIQLNFSERNRSIVKNQRNCFGECNREDCKTVKLIAKFKESKTKTFEAQPKLSEFDYWVQIIGLLTSFAGLSYNEFASVAIEFTRSKVSRRNVRIALFCLKFALLLLGLASFGYLCSRIVIDYQTNSLITKERRSFISPKIVSLAICVKMYRYVHSFSNMRVCEIEKVTDGVLDDVLEGIYLDYGRISFRTDYQVQPKVLFRERRRCFSFTIKPTYRTIPSDPKLEIRFKKADFLIDSDVYLLSRNENLNSESFIYDSQFTFQKRVVKRLRSEGKCMNYKEKYVNCTSRWHCVDRCINRRFLKVYNHTTFGDPPCPVIDRDSFSATEWNTAKLMVDSSSLYSTYPTNQTYNSSVYETIVEQCSNDFPPEESCLEIKFEKTVRLEQERFGKLDGEEQMAKKINLRFDVVQSIEETRSPYKLALDLVNIESIFFGLSVFSILEMIASFVQMTLSVRKNKLVLFIVYLLCSLGGIWHSYQIFNEIVKGELVPTEHYELAKRVQMPVIVFCFRIDENLIDPNHQLTGNYLEELTRKITTESTFINISYLDESNEWIPFDHSRVERFFLLDMKCFRIKIDQVYERNQFVLTADNQVLKANLSRITTSSHQELPDFYFMTRNEETAEFSKIVKLKSYEKSSITHETSLYMYEDRFSFIRRHFLSAQEDASGLHSSDLQEQLLEWQTNEHRLWTLNLPLEEEALDLVVDEHLFEQLYSTQKNRNKHVDLNYQQLFVTNHLRGESNDGSGFWDSHFILSLVFMQKIVSSTNEENIGKLMLSLLNVLFVWFDLGVLDLHPFLGCLQLFTHFIGKINQLLLFTCNWLKKVERRLNETRAKSLEKCEVTQQKKNRIEPSSSTIT